MGKRIVSFCLLAFILHTVSGLAIPISPGAKSGYSIANFSVSAEMASSGQYAARVYHNPPTPGRWLEHIGSGQLIVENIGTRVSLRDRDCSGRTVERNWPFNTLTLEDSRLGDVRFEIEAFAPAAYDDIEITSIPALLAEIRVINRSLTESLSLNLVFEFDPDAAFPAGQPAVLGTGDYYAIASERLGLAFDRPAGVPLPGVPSLFRIERSVQLEPGESKEARLLFLVHSAEGFYTNLWPTWSALADFVFWNWETLRGMTEEIDSRLPRVGDEQLEEYMRWYATAGVSLTKAFLPDRVINMGYTELNQRDAFWTSWIHLFLWPSADRWMIEETGRHQRGDGKIPTTIHPVIERQTDIDINEYYVLRFFRHYEWTRDEAFLAAEWPYIEKAIQYLIGRDIDGDHLPDPVDNSYWADWKDVWSFMHRKYGAHFCLLWVAVLQKAAWAADHLGDAEAAADYASRAALASAKVNASRSGISGGLWTGSFYANLWKGSVFDPDDRVLQDQAVPGVFGALPVNRAPLVFASISQYQQPWGVRETYPYYPDGFLPNPGRYHNGAVWPWLNFADAFARYRYGYPEQAENILRSVGYYDLERSGDYLPHENLNGNTGENDWGHHEIQAWNAAFAGTLYFGALGMERTAADRLKLFPRIPESRLFQNRISFPEGTLHWERFRDGDVPAVRLTSYLPRDLYIEYGFLLEEAIPDPGIVTIGDCTFARREAFLPAGESLILRLQEMRAPYWMVR